MEEVREITYEAIDGVGLIPLARPRYRNAQGYRMLDEIDAAFDAAQHDDSVRVVVLRGSDGVSSAGHGIGSPEQAEYRAELGADSPVAQYDQFRKYNLDLLLKWRNFPKP